VGKRPFDKKGSEGKKSDEELLKEDIVKETEQSTKENEESTSNENNEDLEKKAEEKTEETEETKEKETKSTEEENLNNKLLRLQADFLNYKNRTEKEKVSSYSNAVADVVEDLLPVIDNLERALETDKSEENSFKDGIKMVYTQFVGILDKKGVKEIEALHKQFDHNVHYGVAFDADTEKEDGTIIEVFQKGYRLNDKVIRPSMVKIAKK